MKLILKIDDKNIGEIVNKVSCNKTRTAVRTILLNSNGEMALLYKAKKNEYKLIGGGVDEGEDLEDALKRETLEESGCEIEIVSSLGYVEEYRTKNSFMQTSYIYITRVVKNTNKLHLTKKEIDEGSELCWFKPEIALKKISDSYSKIIPSKYSDLYNTRFIIKRDEAILKYYILNYNK